MNDELNSEFFPTRVGMNWVAWVNDCFEPSLLPCEICSAYFTGLIPRYSLLNLINHPIKSIPPVTE
jgi:hypothetical protein